MFANHFYFLLAAFQLICPLFSNSFHLSAEFILLKPKHQLSQSFRV